MLLTYIKDIVESKRDINTALDLYDIIIEKTLQRDLEKINPNPSEEQIQQWWGITSDVAGYMYRNKKPSITNQELDTIPSVAQEQQFKQRSMLTRTGDEFHFPHKSFYEYFMAYRFILYPEEIQEGTLYSMDFALLRYDELYNAYKEKRPVRFSDLENLSEVKIAGSLHDLGHNLYKLNHFSEAESKYQAALKLFRQLEEQHPGHFINDVTMTLNNLANLHKDTNNHPAAEKEYTEALNINRDLAVKNSNAFLPNVAMTLNNLANLHSETNNYSAAEKEYTEALKTYRDLAEKNPDAFLPYVATTLNNLGELHRNTNNYPVAEKEYNETLKIRRDLAEKNPDAFLPYVADTLENLAILHQNTNRSDVAEIEFNDVLNIRQKLAKNNPDAYLHKVAQTFYNIAVLYLVKEEKDLPAAEAAAQESLAKYKIMAEKSHAAFDPYVEKAKGLLEIIQQLKQQK